MNFKIKSFNFLADDFSDLNEATRLAIIQGSIDDKERDFYIAYFKKRINECAKFGRDVPKTNAALNSRSKRIQTLYLALKEKPAPPELQSAVKAYCTQKTSRRNGSPQKVNDTHGWAKWEEYLNAEYDLERAVRNWKPFYVQSAFVDISEFLAAYESIYKI